MGDTLKTYRPSEVEQYAFCPTYWALRKSGWTTRIATKATVAAIWSTAAHAAFALYQKMKLDGCTDQAQLLTAAQCEAAQVYVADFNHYIAAGVNFGTLDTDDAVGDLRKLVANYTKSCKLDASRGWQVVSVEESLDGEGTTRPDVIVRDPDGILCPVDYKIKRSVNPKWFDHQGWSDDFQYSHKQLHYIHEICKRYDNHIDANVVQLRHYIYAIAAEPFAQTLTAYDITPEYMKDWYSSATRYWMDMHTGVNEGIMHPTHKSPYGMCEMLDFCTKGGAGLSYIKVTKRGDE